MKTRGNGWDERVCLAGTDDAGSTDAMGRVITLLFYTLLFVYSPSRVWIVGSVVAGLGTIGFIIYLSGLQYKVVDWRSYVLQELICSWHSGDWFFIVFMAWPILLPWYTVAYLAFNSYPRSFSADYETDRFRLYGSGRGRYYGMHLNTIREHVTNDMKRVEAETATLMNVPIKVQQKSRLALLLGSVAAYLSAPLGARAQDKGDKDSAQINRTYAGLLYTGSYDSTGTLTPAASVRVGLEALLPVGVDTLTARAAWSSTGSALGHFFLTLPLETDLRLRLGFMGRPISTQKPHPISPGAHFEPPAKQVIPGAASGMSLQWANITVGTYYHQVHKALEVDASMGLKGGVLGVNGIDLAGYLHRVTWGAAITFTTPTITVVLFHEQHTKSSALMDMKITPVSAYLTDLWDQQAKRHNWEVGATKTFLAPHDIQVLLGAGYRPVDRSTGIYLWVYR